MKSIQTLWYVILAIASKYPSQYIHHIREAGLRLNERSKAMMPKDKIASTWAFDEYHMIHLHLAFRIYNLCKHKCFITSSLLEIGSPQVSRTCTGSPINNPKHTQKED
jgi:hypothetical protein